MAPEEKVWKWKGTDYLLLDCRDVFTSTAKMKAYFYGSENEWKKKKTSSYRVFLEKDSTTLTVPQFMKMLTQTASVRQLDNNPPRSLAVLNRSESQGKMFICVKLQNCEDIEPDLKFVKKFAGAWLFDSEDKDHKKKLKAKLPKTQEEEKKMNKKKEEELDTIRAKQDVSEFLGSQAIQKKTKKLE